MDTLESPFRCIRPLCGRGPLWSWPCKLRAECVQVPFLPLFGDVSSSKVSSLHLIRLIKDTGEVEATDHHTRTDARPEINLISSLLSGWFFPSAHFPFFFPFCDLVSGVTRVQQQERKTSQYVCRAGVDRHLPLHFGMDYCHRGVRPPYVEGDGVHRQQHRDGADHLGGPVDDLRGPEHGSDAV